MVILIVCLKVLYCQLHLIINFNNVALFHWIYFTSFFDHYIEQNTCEIFYETAVLNPSQANKIFLWKCPVLIKVTGYRFATWLKLNFFTDIFQRLWPCNDCTKCVQIRSFFWSVFSRIRTDHGEIRSISPYSVRVRENTDQRKHRIWTLFTQCGASPDDMHQ